MRGKVTLPLPSRKRSAISVAKRPSIFPLYRLNATLAGRSLRKKRFVYVH